MIIITSDGNIEMPDWDSANFPIPPEFMHLFEEDALTYEGEDLPQTSNAGASQGGVYDYFDEDDEEDDEPTCVIVTRLPRLLGLNVNE